MMAKESDWALVAEFEAGYQADIAASLLESAGIPVLKQGPETGIFGPGFSGPTPQGAHLFVPRSRLEEAKALLEAGPDSTV